MRSSLQFFLNGQSVSVTGRDAFSMLAPYLRRARGGSGTKIACAHGACGSCSVLLGRPEGESFRYQTINGCIFPLFGCDSAHIITVEGLNGPQNLGGQDTGVLSAVQSAMTQNHGAQCGFCTPGIVVTLTAWHDANRAAPVQRAQVCAALEGNLCRCTGYLPIIEAGMSVETAALPPLNELYPPAPMLGELRAEAAEELQIEVAEDAVEGAQLVFAPHSLQSAARFKAAHPNATTIAGATEIGVAMSVRGAAPRAILSLARVEGAAEIGAFDGVLSLGALANWTQVAREVREIVPEFAALLARWGSPQLRNAGTVAGSLAGRSAISDSLPFLLVCEAELELVGAAQTRRMGIADFLNGEELRQDELIGRVLVPIPAPNQHLRLFKIAKRRAFDRSIVSAAFLLEMREGRIENIRIAMGGVASTVIRLPQTEAFLVGKPLKTAIWREASRIAQSEVSPASDASAGRDYRLQLVANLVRKFGVEVAPD